MEKNSKFNTLKEIVLSFNAKCPSKCWDIFAQFAEEYEAILIKKGLDLKEYQSLFRSYCEIVLGQIQTPMKFEPFHQAVRSPLDCYNLGLSIFRPLIDFPKSTLREIANISKIQDYLNKGENVILYANHQIEADPQAMALLLETQFPQLAEKMIAVAGERVVTDPLAVPFSLGINLFCIYSKKYFDIHTERRVEMQEHNKTTMLLLGSHLSKGGKLIWIAPSGGRDRRNKDGVLEVAKFDPQSIELLYLLGRKSKCPTHFFPLALSTHDILPPPEGIQAHLGEKRATKEAAIHLFFGDEIDMENFPHEEGDDKAKKKDARAHYIWQLVTNQYQQLPS